MSELPWEELSRLLDGELEPEASEALRARIAAEPELAEAWAALQALPRELSALPDLAPPPGLNAAVLGEVALPDAAAPRRAPYAWVIGALAALLLLSLRPQAQTLTQLSGDQLVEGELRVLAAGALPIDVDGRALIRVEPPLPRMETDMALKELLAAAAGAAITVAVYEGTASYLPQDADAPVVVEAGQEVRVDAAGRPAPRPERRVVIAQGPEAPSAPVEALADDDLRAEVEKLRFENTLLRGQVRAAQGVVQDWPEGTPAALDGERMEAGLVEALGAQGELLSLDCAEYPCLASIHLADGYDREALEAALGDFKAGVAEDAGLETLGMMLGIAEAATEEGAEPEGVAVLALLQPSDLEDPDLKDRLHTREREAFDAAWGDIGQE